MNSNGEYTICNLDNHTYSSNYPPDGITASSGYGGYANVNNGLAESGQLSYGANAGVPTVSSGPDHLGHPGQHPQHPGGHPMYGHHQNQTSVISPTSPPPHGYGPLQHHPHPHHNSCLPPPGQHFDYYGGSVITNGSPGVDLNSGLYSPYGPPEPSPGQPPHCGIPTTSGPHHYDVHDSPIHSLSPSTEHPPVTTYKWMTVKRSVPKPGESFIPFPFPHWYEEPPFPIPSALINASYTFTPLVTHLPGVVCNYTYIGVSTIYPSPTLFLSHSLLDLQWQIYIHHL